MHATNDMTQAGSSRMRRVFPWLTLAVFAAVALVQGFLPDVWDIWLTLATTGFVVVATACCAIWMRGTTRWAWALIGAGMLANAIGDVVYEVLARMGTEVGTVTVADPFYLATYPFLLAGIVMLVRARTRGRLGDVFIDATAVAVIAGLVVWQAFVVSPGVLLSGTLTERLVVSAYPMADVLVIAALAMALFSSARARTDLRLLTAFAFALLVADLSYTSFQLFAVPSWVEQTSYAMYYLAYGFIAAAALVQLRDRALSNQTADRPRTSVSYLRIVLLAIALCGAPGFAIASVVFDYAIQVPTFIGATIVVTVLVLIRFVGLVRRLETEQRRLTEAEAKLFHQAHHDALTGLPNRTVLTKRLEQELQTAREGSGELALMFVDLDRFKQVNDTLGHRAGDELLRAVAARIRAALRSDDLCARTGGDEFVVVATALADPDAATALAEAVVAAITVPLMIGGQVCVPGVSIGVALRHAHPTADELLAEADQALYRAKAAGGGRMIASWQAARGTVSTATAAMPLQAH